MWGGGDDYRISEFIGCSDENGGAKQTVPFACQEEDDPYTGKTWIYSNVTFDKKTGLFAVNFGGCKEPTCTDPAKCSKETYLLAGGSPNPGDVLSGYNCSLSKFGKKGGYFVRYSVVGGDFLKNMAAKPPAKTALLKQCSYNASSSGGGLCAEDWTMWPVHEQCFHAGKDEGSEKTACEADEGAVIMTQWTSRDTCDGPEFKEKYYKDQAKSCGVEEAGYYVEFCSD